MQGPRCRGKIFCKIQCLRENKAMSQFKDDAMSQFKHQERPFKHRITDTEGMKCVVELAEACQRSFRKEQQDVAVQSVSTKKNSFWGFFASNRQTNPIKQTDDNKPSNRGPRP